MRRICVGSVTKSQALALVLVLAGCGGASSQAEKPAPSDKASTAQDANPAGPAASTAVQAASKPAPPAAPVELGDTRQLATVLDLTKLPLPERAVVSEPFATNLHVSVPLSVPAATKFFLEKLQALGWQKAGGTPVSDNSDSFAQISLGKDGYQLQLMAMSSKPQTADVTITQLGNLDTRTLPRTEAAEDQYSSATSSLYFTTVKVAEAAATLRRLLTADGWQEYDRAFSQKADRPDTADMLFRKKAYSLDISISRPPAQPDKTAVQYSVTTLTHDLPAPRDARHVEVGDSQWKLMCEIPHDVKGAAEYYRKAMLEIGFPKPPLETPIDKSLTLSFKSEGHDVVLVTLKPAGEHTTKVELEGYSAAFLEAAKKAEAEAQVKREAEKKAGEQARKEAVKAFEERSKKQDEMINGAIEKALHDANLPAKQSEPAKP